MDKPRRAVAIGCRAWPALRAAGGRVRRFAVVSGAWYLEAGSEIIWATHGGALSHPRALVLAEPLPSDWPGGRLAPGDAPASMPVLPPLLVGGPQALERRAARLTRALAEGQSPLGMGKMLRAEEPEFPFNAARGAAQALSSALRAGNSQAMVTAATALFGLGPGLTPSGDDYLCGALFATHLLATVEAKASLSLAALRALIAGAAWTHTNRISAALLRDAAEGLGFVALHAVCGELAGGDEKAAFAAACRLAAIGHSSGWDMLTGLLGTLAGLP
jgi:hypothetical protein